MSAELPQVAINYLTAGTLGVSLAIFWIVVVAASKLWALVWAWIDDTKAPKQIPIISVSMRMFGYMPTTEGYDCWEYRHKNTQKGSDGDIGLYMPLATLMCAPLVLLVAFDLYPVTIAVATSYALAHLARFARRHKKLFDQHLTDPEAHTKNR